MQSYSNGALAFLIAYPLFACGGAVKNDAASGDAGAEAAVPLHDGGAPLPDTFVPPAVDAAPDATVPSGPGVLLFAGYGEAPLNDTWDWNGTTWTELDIMGPSARAQQSMIGLGANVLLFGGQGLGGLGPALGDTWQWSTMGWTQLTVAAPSAREGGATAVLNGKVILYGGQGSGGAFLSDTWEWDGAKWTELTITGPTPGGRFGHSMATLGNVIVLFGNVGGPTDTWTFDGTAWTQAATVGPTGEDGGLSESRGFQTMATLDGKVILFGGEQDANHILNDTWAWDGASWTELTVSNPPPARFNAGMTTFQEKIVLFGGATPIPGAGWLGDTWTWDGADWTEAATDGPSPRYGYVLAAHP
jgi:hypothetical protein